MMAEYIEREAAYKFMFDIPNPNGAGEIEVVSVDDLDSIPDADVVPVRHGRWFLDGDYEYINCSECLCSFYMGFETSSDARQYLARDDKLRFCPTCGALMDKDGDGHV